MLGSTSTPNESAVLPLQVERDQAASSQNVTSGQKGRLLWTGLGFGVLMLIGVSACALDPLASHASAKPSHLVPEVAFMPAMPLLQPGSGHANLKALRPAAGPVGYANLKVSRPAVIPGAKQFRQGQPQMLSFPEFPSARIRGEGTMPKEEGTNIASKKLTPSEQGVSIKTAKGFYFTGKTTNGFPHDNKLEGTYVSTNSGAPIFESSAEYDSSNIVNDGPKPTGNHRSSSRRSDRDEASSSVPLGTVIGSFLANIKQPFILALMTVALLFAVAKPALAVQPGNLQAPTTAIVRSGASSGSGLKIASEPVGLDLRREGRVMDKSTSRVMDESTAQKMSTTIMKTEAETGAEVQVLIVDKLAASPDGTQMTPKQFATSIFNQWHIGPGDKNNGVLLLHVLDERRVEIEVGAGLNPYMNSSWCTRLVETEAVPLMKQGRYAEGLANVVEGVQRRLRDIDNGLVEPQKAQNNTGINSDTVGTVVLAGLALVLPSSDGDSGSSGRYNGGGSGGGGGFSSGGGGGASY